MSGEGSGSSPAWAALNQLLDDTAVEDLGTSGDTVRQAAASTAEWVALSLQHIGFRHLTTPSGEAFCVDRFDFPTTRS
jgi:hypothetical protein